MLLTAFCKELIHLFKGLQQGWLRIAHSTGWLAAVLRHCIDRRQSQQKRCMADCVVEKISRIVWSAAQKGNEVCLLCLHIRLQGGRTERRCTSQPL